MSNTLFVKSQQSLRAAVTILSSSSGSAVVNGGVAVTVVCVDAGAAALSLQDWGALIGALALPHNLLALRTLDFDNIANNSVANLVVPHIAGLARNCKFLRALSVSRAPLTPETARFVGTALAGHGSLRRLALVQCDLRDAGAEQLASTLLAPIMQPQRGATSAAAGDEAVAAIESIDLGHNDIRGGGCATIAAAFKSLASTPCALLPNLNRICLRGNHHDKLPAILEREPHAARQPRERGARPLPALPEGESLRFMSCGVTEPRCPMPALQQMTRVSAEQVQ